MLKKRFLGLAILLGTIALILTFTACPTDSDDGGSSHKHTWGEWTITTAPNFTTDADGEETRACSGCSSTEKRTYACYAIGDEGPGGGKIFYRIQAGFTMTDTGTTAYYLEAAPADEGSSIQWGAYGELIEDVTTFTDTFDSKALLIGNGRRDTQIIANYLATKETGRAAQVCADKKIAIDGKTYKDWFLPSLGELRELFKLKGKYGIPDTGLFWASSQGSDKWAWFLDFFEKYYDYQDKDAKNNVVRAIRAF